MRDIYDYALILVAISGALTALAASDIGQRMAKLELKIELIEKKVEHLESPACEWAREACKMPPSEGNQK